MENQSSKSVHVNFSLRAQYCPLISMNNSVIPHVSQDKYLGFILDRRLTWGPPHLNDIRNKTVYFTSSDHYSGLKSILKINYCYTSLLCPIWTCGILFWDPVNKKMLRQSKPFSPSAYAPLQKRLGLLQINFSTTNFISSQSYKWLSYFIKGIMQNFKLILTVSSHS